MIVQASVCAKHPWLQQRGSRHLFSESVPIRGDKTSPTKRQLAFFNQLGSLALCNGCLMPKGCKKGNDIQSRLRNIRRVLKDVNKPYLRKDPRYKSSSQGARKE